MMNTTSWFNYYEDVSYNWCDGVFILTYCQQFNSRTKHFKLYVYLHAENVFPYIQVYLTVKEDVYTINL